MQNGVVKWFSDQKGFGFILSGGKDYFVHFKAIECDGFKTLKENDKVCFHGENSPRGLIATRVSLEPSPD